MVPTKDAFAIDRVSESVRLGVGERSLVVSPMGVGAWSWGDQDVWGYGGYDKDFSDDSIKTAFEASVKAGVTFFDTAEVPPVILRARSAELLHCGLAFPHIARSDPPRRARTE